MRSPNTNIQNAQKTPSPIGFLLKIQWSRGSVESHCEQTGANHVNRVSWFSKQMTLQKTFMI